MNCADTVACKQDHPHKDDVLREVDAEVVFTRVGWDMFQFRPWKHLS